MHTIVLCTKFSEEKYDDDAAPQDPEAESSRCLLDTGSLSVTRTPSNGVPLAWCSSCAGTDTS